jgi:predicted nucleotidyltransferase
MKFGLQEDTIKKIKSIFEKHHGIEQVIIYGSRSKGNYKNGSDIDFAFVGTLSNQAWTDINSDLDELMTPYTFDLSRLSTIENPDLIDHIKRIGQVFYDAKERV